MTDKPMTTPPSGDERAAFEREYVKVCGYPAATINSFWNDTVSYYMDDGLQSHWLLWLARAKHTSGPHSPAPGLSEIVALLNEHLWIDQQNSRSEGRVYVRGGVDEAAKAIIDRLTAREGKDAR